MISRDDFKIQLQSRKENAEDILKKYLPKEGLEEELQQNMIQAMNYSCLVGGKRIRPILMAETYHFFGGSEKVIEPFMAAIEMIHSFSLVHDDLPCIDNDRLRRGKPTTWDKFGEDAALLAGDALSIYAFETAAKGFALSSNAEQVGKAVSMLAKEAGVYGMCGGQAVDVERTGKPLDDRTLDFIYRLKTGALLRASLGIGAVLAGASDEDTERILLAADHIGMAFQVVDDILDMTSTTEEIGKPAGSDEKNGKTTYAVLHGLDEAEKRAEEDTQIAAELLEQLEMIHGQKDSFLKELVLSLAVRKQ